MNTTLSYLLNCAGIDISCDGAVTLQDHAIGILHPNALYTFRNGDLFVVGANAKRIDRSSALLAIKDLVACGAVIPGDESHIEYALKILNCPHRSRTATYLLSFAQSLNTLPIAFDALKTSRVAIIGCGGIGSLCAYLLAGGGVGNITLIDHDVIERSNFNRQVFWTTQDIGKKKTDVLKAALKLRFNDDVEIKVIDEILGPKISESLSDFHLAVVTVDTPLGIYAHIASSLVRAGVAVIGGGYQHTQCGVYEDPVSIWANADHLPQWSFCSPNPIAPSFGPVNAEIAGLIANRAIQRIVRLANNGIHDSVQWADSSKFPRCYKYQHEKA